METVTGVTVFEDFVFKFGVEVGNKSVLDVKSIAAATFCETKVFEFIVTIVSVMIWPKTPDIPEPVSDVIDMWESKFEVDSVMIVMLVIFGSIPCQILAPPTYMKTITL